MFNNKDRVLIAPSILSADFASLARDVKKVEEAGVEVLHLDVMDGVFVPPITFGQGMVKALSKVTDLALDVHLMIVEPDRHLESFAQAGASAITVHGEVCTHLHRTIHTIRDLGVKAGVALNPHTHEDVLKYVIQDLDLVLIMTVNPGFGGQAFIPEVVPKLERVSRLIRESGSKAVISVDGGVSAANAKLLAQAGARMMVAGSAIFNDKMDPQSGVQLIQDAIGGK